MSLKHAAQHLAAQGRGPDTTLVHMTPREVSGLQAIARAHGGSLTINPETGLAEAGFLDKLMPMIVGAGLAYATGGMSLGAGLGMAGVSNAAIIGGGIGALETMRTGDLGKGIMSGLGAYGGAGLGGAAESAGMFKDAATVPAAPNVAPTSFEAGAFNSPAYNPTPTQFSAFGDAPGSVTSVDPSSFGDFGQAPPITSMAPVSDAAQQAASSAMGNVTVAQPPPSIGELIMQNKGYAAAGAAPAIMDAMSPKRDMPEADKGMIRPYTFDYNKQQVSNPIGSTRQNGQDTSERLYFQPKFTPLPPYKAAGGGLMSLARMATGEDVMPTEREERKAGGGPVEQMSNANAIGANTGYPMANVNKAAYATPYQTPVNQNVVTGTADTGVNPMTGEQNRFAEGGITGSGNLDLHIPLDLGGGGGGLGGGTNGYLGLGSGGRGGLGSGLGFNAIPTPVSQEPFFDSMPYKSTDMRQQLLDTLQQQQLQQQQQNMGLQQQALGNASVKPTVPYMENPEITKPMRMATGGMAYAQGGISTLGGYSDGGRLLKGPGDGMSDNIPAQIGSKQPARLADGEFVVPADVVSHLGNGSTDAGAKQLYKMMDRIRAQRTGKKKQAPEVNPAKAMPA